MILYFFIILPAFFSIYLLFMWSLLNALKSEPAIRKSDSTVLKEKISIVIPFRNEANVLESCVSSLCALDYPSDDYEIILVNDHSEDAFLARIEAFKENITLLNSIEKGKKQAIEYGIKNAVNPWILTSDADCTYDKNWLASIHQLIQSHEADLYVLPVLPLKEKGALESYQYLESLINIAFNNAYFRSKNEVLLASGANLLFSKRTFLKNDPYSNNRNISSGDDMFLLQSFKKNRRIQLSVKKGLWVRTGVETNISSAIDQRLRWLSKMKNLKDDKAFTFGLLASSFHFVLLVGVLMSFLFPIGIVICFFILITKALLERKLVRGLKSSGEKTPSFYTLFIFELVSLFTIPLLVILSIFRNPKWKGRNIAT